MTPVVDSNIKSVAMREPIAIVGSACRFPGSARSPTKLWGLLHRPRDILTEFEPGRLNLSSFYHPNGEHHGSTNVPNKSYLLEEHHCDFDASFFNINPAEADGMDPQQRVLLETTYEALEAAGYTLEQMLGSPTSVFVGVMTSDYRDIQNRDLDTIGRWHATGTAPSILSNRISYYFDLKGPSMTINTACSSSLVALHQAVQSLRSSESKTAIVAGVNLILDPSTYISESKLHMLSPTSRCRMWDENADGYARGEGCASIILKTLSHALADGDDIECIIRETSVNSDGRSTGITMPDPEAQASLIKQTYLNSGLDPVKDRCQYFECHGTGTPAGDPIEAQAIQQTFFPKNTTFSPEDRLYVGSIKTVIGHLEGCAGLAGLLKAVMCIKNQTISPNLLFNKLNPSIAPFYDHLQIPTQDIPWPPVTPGNPLRASVNSFGFGGTNAHAIIESYTPLTSNGHGNYRQDDRADEAIIVGPFVFSAHTRSSLLSNIKNYACYIRSSPSLNLDDLAWVLSSKRTSLPLKLSFTGASREELLETMEKAVSACESSPDSEFGIPTRRSQSEPCGVLGVFTGQGAQWATMGRDLIGSSQLFRDSIDRCQRALESLPDGPSWSLKDELIADEASSRLSEAALSQPLTTAIEIATCDLLSAARIHLDAVVGHSSGEIAAVYAAGIISAEDAMKIAYYRGLHAKPPKIRDVQQPGGMMAVGMSFDDAMAFCAQPSFSGRVAVAASNGPASITLSGDYDAIDEAKRLFDQKKTFSRILKVDVAYHSHHMLSCAGAYLTSLKACHIQVRPPRKDCMWISSVRGDRDLLNGDLSELSGQYWVDNMLQPVLFSQAIEHSLWNGERFGICIEVGPHPALKGPVSQTLKPILGEEIPYLSVLQRGVHDVKAASSAMGFVWQHLGPQSVDLDQYRRAFKPQSPRMLKGLPTYSWDHSKEYWRESRISRRYRLHEPRSHPLLGRRAPDDSENDMRWRNILLLDEISWLQGHKFQGQVLFPAACYVALALETAVSVAAGRSLALVEIHDLSIVRPLTLKEGIPGVEIITTLRVSHGEAKNPLLTGLEADFACYTSPNHGTTLERSCTARVALHFGNPEAGELPARPPRHQNLVPVDLDALYELFESNGLSYTGLFRGINSMSRTLNHAIASASWPKGILSSEYLFHPAALEASFQSLVGAFSSPFSNALWTTYLPVGIRRIFINPNLSYLSHSEEVKSDIDASVTASSASLIEGDVSLFDLDGNSIIQVEGLILKAINEPDPSNDRGLFSHIVWETDPFVCSVQMDQYQPDTEEKLKVVTIERTALFYFQRILCEIDPREVSGFNIHHQLFYNEIRRVVDTVKYHQHPTLKPEWLDDSEEYITGIFHNFPGQVELELMHLLGHALPAILRGEIDPVKIFKEKDRLNRLYLDGATFAPMHKSVCDVIKRIVHKHPHMDIFEIGAGTGITTSQVLDAIGSAYASYCYTDISSELVEKAAEKMTDRTHKMTFKVIDIERDVTDQGCETGKYDMVVAANVLHATHKLNETLRNIRLLLKPGGYLVLMEVTGQMVMFLLCIMGFLPEWWHGYDEGRQTWPGISPAEWDKLLRSTGFSGVDSVQHNLPHPEAHCLSVIVSQAVDDLVMMLREPATSMSLVPVAEQVLIVGGKTLLVSRLVNNLKSVLASSGTAIKVVDDIENLDIPRLQEGTSVISATELDKPFFSDRLTPKRLLAIQELFKKAKSILWLTAGRLSNQPHANMTVGIGRAIISEQPNVNLQFLDVSKVSSLIPTTVVDVFLRLSWSRLPGFAEKNMLWTNEPEIHVDGRTLLVPRLVRDHERNERYNTGRRQVIRDMSLDQVPVELKVAATNGTGNVFVQRFPKSRTEVAGSVPVKVRFSIPLLPQFSKRLFLWLGTTTHDEKWTAIGISEHDSSVVQAKLDDAYILKEEDEVNSGSLRATASYIIASLLATSTPSYGSFLIYAPHEILTAAISTSRHWCRRRVYFVTSKPVKSETEWISIHPRASRHAIERALPKDVSSFLDLSTSSDDKLRTTLCIIYDKVRLETASFGLGAISLNQRQLITESYAEAKATLANVPWGSPDIFSVKELSGLPTSTYTYPTMVDWARSTKVPVHSESLDTRSLFSSSKSYFMVEMMSPLGLSILSWMARNGARTFVLTSRSPRVDPGWLEEMSALGASVKVMKMDVSDNDSVSSVYRDVSQTLPPVAGVCNAAMVLSANLFEDTAVDDLGVALGSKIHGTTYLDVVFSKPTLDFFILFSSLGAVMGTPGQSSHHAASLFMSSLVQQRRQKGLAASIIYMGMVVDVGYVAKQGKDVIQHMMKLGHTPLSEPDIHHSFAEAVIASDPDSTGSSEIIIGLEPVKRPADDQNRPPWYSNPLLSHFVVDDDVQGEQQQKGSSNLNIRQQLEDSISKEQASQILLECFSAKVESMLQLSAKTLDTNIPLLDLGCDSLLAVEIRTWFFKKISIDIPALSTLQSTASELCSDAVAQFLAQRMTEQAGQQSAEETDSSDTPTVESKLGFSSPDRMSPPDLDSSETSALSSPLEPGSAELSSSPVPRKFKRLEQMSPYQSLIWFAGNYMKDPTQYNIVISYRVKGTFQLARFERALVQVVARHESLRTAFFADPISGELLQGVLGSPMPFFHHIKTSDPALVSQEFENAASHEWQLDQGETFRVTVVSLEPHQHTVIFSYHHIIMDGVSWSAFLRDVKCFYEMRMPPADIAQYIDYSAMHNRAIQDGAFNQEIDYWKRELSPLPDVMPLLPFAKVKYRTSTDDYKAHTTTREIGRERVDKIRKTSQTLRGTVFHFYLATLQVLFARLLNIENMCIGMSDANRKHERFSNTVGYFVNLLPLKFRVYQDDSFANVFQRTSVKVLSALSNSSVPSNLVVDNLNIQRASTHTPLFQVAINYRVGEITQMSVADFELDYDRSAMGNAPYDMSFHITPTAAGTCILEVTCRDYLYTRQAAGLVLDMYINLIDSFSSDSLLSVQNCTFSPPTSDEGHISIRRGPRLLHEWPATLPERFQNIVEMYGGRIAIKEEVGEFSYSQLAAHSNCIANALLEKGIAPGANVAVLCQPSLNSVASLLAILRIGGVYVPLDLSIPPARHMAMIEASATSVIVCSSSTLEMAMGLGAAVVINASEAASYTDIPTKNRGSGSSPSILLYTSGSTGKPKGVLLPQVGFINYLAAKAEELSLDKKVTVLQQSSLGFDMGLAQTFNAIMNGGKLVIVPQTARGDPVEIASLIRNEKVTFTLATPSEYIVILQHGREHLQDYTLWRHACLGGEPFTDQLKREFVQLGQNCPVIQDSYGVTEISACTTFETMSVSQLEGAHSVGKPIPNTSIYIVDGNCNPVHVGFPGEICVGGVGIALGYLDREQTRLKFVEDRFATNEDIARGWTRMYRTGDKGRLLENGSLILMGRMDGNTEIKLRGLRIDLEDVASTLVNSAPDVLSSAIVCVKGEGDSRVLVAYVALVPGRTASETELQRFASGLPVPQYMCPAAVIRLNDLPRNPNGKIDRKAIEALPLMSVNTQSQSSRRLTLGEGELKLLWQGILPNNDQVQPESDFFMLGGNSLLLVKLQGAIRTSIGVSLTIRELYGSSTLASMATKVSSKKAESPLTSINWSEETAIPRTILDGVSSTSVPHRPRDSGCEILLTGSTSFLGRTIVRVLLEKPAVNKIHCIAVEKGHEDVIPASGKVVVYYGSLLDSTLGLSTTEYTGLQSCIDVVVHAGANGHCLNFYSSLRTPNLFSTHFLALFSLQTKIPLHYISSGRVILLSGRTSLGPVSVSSYHPPADGSEGLTATKWASESFLERFAEQTGLAVCIHRPCTPISDQAPHEDALNSLLYYSLVLGATPRLTNMGGYLDFQKVEVIAEEIATQVTLTFTARMNNSPSPPSSVVFCHHSSNVKVPVKSFKEYMEKVHNRPFGELSLSDWTSRAIELGIEPLITTFLEAVAENAETMFFPYLGTQHED